MRPRFHHHKAALGNGFQFVRRHQRTLHHLQALAGIVLSAADRAGQYSAAAQRFGELLRRLAVGCKAAEDGILTVVSQYFCAFSAVILLQLRQRLDDGYQCDTTGATRAEQRLHVKGGHSSELITIEHHAAGQTPAVLVRHGEQLPRQRLYHQARHEVLGGVLLRQDEEDGGLLCRKLLGVGGAVEAQHLLQLRVQKGVEPGQHRGHDGGHGLLGGIQRCTGKPPGLVYVRQSVHQKCKPVFAANAGGC